MRKLLAIVALGFAVLFASGASFASTPDYNWVQGTAQSSDFTKSNNLGFEVAGSKALGGVLFVKGDFDRQFWNDARTDSARLGLGVHADFSNGASLYGDVYGLHKGILSKDVTNIHSYGYGVEGGGRFDVAGPVELDVGIASERITAQANWLTYATGGVVVNVYKGLAVVGEARWHDSANKDFNVGLRYSF